jgi:N6-adenosine-specific RNA methylase IME4
LLRYKIIYADPPWQYERNKGSGVAENHYMTMSTQDICALPVMEIADEDSVLFLWATFPNLPEAMRVIKAWGYTYKTVAFVWIKKNKKSDSLFWGLGFWTRSNAEVCLLATRGNIRRESAKVHQVIIAPVSAHSQKPEEARERIVELVGDLPRIELFARQRPEGWHVWGNEVDCDIDLHSVPG